MDDLPDELLLMILAYVGSRDLRVGIGVVSRRMTMLARDRSIVARWRFCVRPQRPSTAADVVSAWRPLRLSWLVDSEAAAAAAAVSFPSVQALSCKNGVLGSVRPFGAAQFPNLRTLSLSYNSLWWNASRDWAPLAALTRLSLTSYSTFYSNNPAFNLVGTLARHGALAHVRLRGVRLLCRRLAVAPARKLTSLILDYCHTTTAHKFINWNGREPCSTTTVSVAACVERLVVLVDTPSDAARFVRTMSFSADDKASSSLEMALRELYVFATSDVRHGMACVTRGFVANVVSRLSSLETLYLPPMMRIHLEEAVAICAQQRLTAVDIDYFIDARSRMRISEGQEEKLNSLPRNVSRAVYADAIDDWVWN